MDMKHSHTFGDQCNKGIFQRHTGCLQIKGCETKSQGPVLLLPRSSSEKMEKGKHVNSSLTLSGKRRSLLWSLGSLMSHHCQRTSWELGQKERKRRIKTGAGLSSLSDTRAGFLLQTKIKELFLELFL